MVKIDLSSLAGNLLAVRRLVDPRIKVMGVVKSDAYGHGLLPVSRVLEETGIDCLGVAYLDEALELRNNGIRCPVVILCGIRTREEAAEILSRDLTPVIYDLEAAELLAAECRKRGRKIGIQLKVDTGMARLGVNWEEVGDFLRRLADFHMLEVMGLTSHLSSADEPSPAFTDLQIERFSMAVKEGRGMGFSLPLNNLANSAGVMHYRKSHFEMVRPGIMLYGGLPSPDFLNGPTLAPVMHFQGKVLQVRDLPCGTPVGYGRTYCTNCVKKVAVLSAGYGDGVPRSLSAQGAALVRSKRCDILGRICMDLTICDVSDVEDVAPGDEVVFLGCQGREAITGDEMARWGNTISYEIFCSIGQRHAKEYFT